MPTHDELVAAFREAFAVDKDESPMLVQRIPLICQDIRTMKGDLAEIKDNIKWGVRIVLGAVLLALVGVVLTTHLSLAV
jgi:hypothetical protein